jgi:hypothetical protein
MSMCKTMPVTDSASLCVHAGRPTDRSRDGDLPRLRCYSTAMLRYLLGMRLVVARFDGVRHFRIEYLLRLSALSWIKRSRIGLRSRASASTLNSSLVSGAIPNRSRSALGMTTCPLPLRVLVYVGNRLLFVTLGCDSPPHASSGECSDKRLSGERRGWCRCRVLGESCLET